MLKKGSFLLLLSFAVIFISCSPKQSDIVVAKYGNNKITMKEFEDAYAKSTGGYDAAKKDSLSRLKNFLDLYVNFKMKLRDAEVRGLSQDSSLLAELNDYKKRVGVTYLVEKDIVEPAVKDLYEKRKEELRVSHIMFRPDSTGEEACRKLAQSVLDSIKAGADFAEMARKYSVDKGSAAVGGDIYYFTGGQLPEEFENAMYKTQAGQVYPEVVRTKYGFHIIKVTERHPRVPKIRASHILIGFNNAKGEVDTVAAKARIDSVAEMLKQGKDFAELAAKYSEDGSKQVGGDLNFLERKSTVREFDEAVFKLNVGEVSPVIRTQFGYHLIKVTDKKPLPSYEEDKENIKKIFRQTRYQEKYDAFVDSLKKKYQVVVDEGVLLALAENRDSAKVGGELKITDAIQDKPVITYTGSSVTVNQFLQKLNEQQDLQGKLITPQLLSNAAKKISGDVILEQEALNLDKTDPRFASLMEDYKNGIFIFKLQEDEVWNKINLDSSKIYEFYTNTKNNYVWPDRVNYSEIFARKDSLINYYYSLLQNGENFDSVAAKYTERPGFKEKAGLQGLVEIKTPAAIEASKLQPGDYSKPFKNESGFSIVKLNSKEPSRLKTFEEAKAEASGQFQDAESKRLEQVYIDTLKKTYSPVINYDVLQEAFSGQKSEQTTAENTDKASN